MMRKYFINCLLCVFTVLFFVSFAGTAFAIDGTLSAERVFPVPESDEDRVSKTVKVGWPTQGNLASVDKNGNPSGYTYEYLMRVKQFTGWNYEFEIVNGSDDIALIALLAKLKNGEIDMMGGLGFNYNKPETVPEKQDYATSVSPYGTSYNVLTTLDSNADFLTVTDLIRSPEPVKIATINAPTINAQLKYFFDINKINYQIVENESVQQQKEAVRTGRADLMTDVDISMNDEFRIVAKFKSKMLGFGVANDKPDILDELNEAITNIDETSPGFQVELYQKYFESGKNLFVLSKEEKAFVDKNAIIPVFVNPNMAPFQYIRDGNIKGITRDVLALVAERSGLKFSFQQTNFLSIDELNNTKGNLLVASIPYTYAMADLYNVQLATPYATVPMSLIANAETVNKDKSQSVIAVIKGEEVSSLVGYKKIEYYETMKECMDAVERGEVDFAYGNSYSTMYFGFQYSYKNLISAPVGTVNVHYCIGVSKSADKPLLSIINKALRSIDAGRIYAIISENTKAVDTDFSLGNFILQNPLQTLIIACIVFGMIAAGFLSFMVVKVRANRRLVVDAKRFNQLSDISDEYLFEYDVKSDLYSVSQKYAEVLGVPRELSHCKTHNDCPPFLTNALRGERVSEVEMSLADGSKNWFRVFHTPVLNEKKVTVSIIGKLINIQESKEEINELYEKSVKDDLTKLYKIGYFWDYVNEKLIENPRKPGQFLIFDLDGFKGINDTFGHLEGDRVLKEVADVLSQVFRSEDTPARLGGDEFVIYMHGATQIVAVKRAKETLKKVEKLNLNVRVSLSCGICETVSSTNYEDVYRVADNALYRAKAKGGNCIEVTSDQSEKLPEQ